MVLSSGLQKEIEATLSKTMQIWNAPGLPGESRIPCIKTPEDWIDPLGHVFKKL